MASEWNKHLAEVTCLDMVLVSFVADFLKGMSFAEQAKDLKAHYYRNGYCSRNITGDTFS